MSETPSIPTSRRMPAAAAGVLALAILAAYHNSLAGPFVFDDSKSIVDNPTLRHLWPIGGPLSPPSGLGVAGRPLLNLSLAIDYAISGTQVWSYHALNLLIHILAALTLFGIVRRTLSRWSALSPTRFSTGGGAQRVGDNALHPVIFAFLVALLWAVHPLQTASVTYVIQRSESLMGLCYLLTLYSFIRGTELEETRFAGPEADRSTESASGGELLASLPASGLRDPRAAGSAGRSGIGQLRPSGSGLGGPIRLRPCRRWYIFSFLACLLGMATKEVMATAPLMVLLYDRTFVAGTFREAWRRHRVLYLGLAGTWLLLGALMAGLPSRGIGFAYGVSGWAYGLTECGVVVRYLGLAVWPHPLVLDYDTPIVTQAAVAAPDAAILLPLLAGTLWALWRRPVLGFVGCWFFVILAPSSSFIPVALQPMAENRMYLPLAAIVVLAVRGIAALPGRSRWVVGLALAAGLGRLTVQRNRDYQTEVGLWTDTVAKNPGNPRAQYNLATVLLKDGRAADAIPHFEQSLRIKADDPEVLYNLGFALAETGRLEESMARYEEALRLQPDSAKVHNNLGIALARSGRRTEALAHFAEAVRIEPGYAEAQNNWGNVLYEMGRPAEACDHLEAAVQLQPDTARFRIRLAMALARSGRLADAIAQFEEVLRLQPADAATHYNLGLLLRAAGRADEAEAQFEVAARLGAMR